MSAYHVACTRRPKRRLGPRVDGVLANSVSLLPKRVSR